MELPVSELRPGDYFQVLRRPGAGNKVGLKAIVVEAGPSTRTPGHTRIVTSRTITSSRFLVFPEDMVVDILQRHASPEDAVPPKAGEPKPSSVPVAKPRCRCKNHMGTQKILFKSREDAVEALMRRHLRHGTHRIYPCPTVEGRFHITSKKERVHDPKG